MRLSVVVSRNVLSRALQRHGWSDGALAARLPISRARLNRIKNRRSAPTLSEALLIARALECTVADLFSLPNEEMAGTDGLHFDDVAQWPEPAKRGGALETQMESVASYHQRTSLGRRGVRLEETAMIANHVQHASEVDPGTHENTPEPSTHQIVVGTAGLIVSMLAIVSVLAVTGCGANLTKPSIDSNLDRSSVRQSAQPVDERVVAYHDLFAAPVRLSK